MSTTTELISNLFEERKNLANNLNLMGVRANNTEKFNTLVPKVLDIPKYQKTYTDIWTPTENTIFYEMKNIPFIPKKITITSTCSELPTDKNTLYVVSVVNEPTDSNPYFCLYRCSTELFANGFGYNMGSQNYVNNLFKFTDNSVKMDFSAYKSGIYSGSRFKSGVTYYCTVWGE